MSILIISGISGAGKSLACNTLEDAGYFCIDNLPPQLLLPVCQMQMDSQIRRNLAIVVDSRSLERFNSFNAELDRLDQNGIDYKLLFIYTSPEVILKRFKQTRRTHPLVSEETPSLQEAINKEYELCRSIQERADYQIDTTNLKSGQFRDLLLKTFSEEEYRGLSVKLVSFGYRNGIPSEADLVYDVRCMPNPFYIDELKQKDGTDQEVYDFVFNFSQSHLMEDKIMEFITTFMPFYQEEGKNELVIAIGCTSGHHRSVAFVESITKKLRDQGHRVVTIHRDIDKEF